MYEVTIDQEYGECVVVLTNKDTDESFEGRGETLPDALRELAREMELACGVHRA